MVFINTDAKVHDLQLHLKYVRIENVAVVVMLLLSAYGNKTDLRNC